MRKVVVAALVGNPDLKAIGAGVVGGVDVNTHEDVSADLNRPLNPVIKLRVLVMPPDEVGRNAGIRGELLKQIV